LNAFSESTKEHSVKEANDMKFHRAVSEACETLGLLTNPSEQKFRLRRFAAALLAIASVAVAPVTLAAGDDGDCNEEQHWVGSWATGPGGYC
jgi:hypothetical protein